MDIENLKQEDIEQILKLLSEAPAEKVAELKIFIRDYLS